MERMRVARRIASLRRGTVIGVVALTLVGCGGEKTRENAASSDRSVVAPSTAGIVRSGNAATNPACALLDLSDVQKILPQGQKFTEINGTTTPGRFAANIDNCFWITNGTNPWLVSVTLEQNLGPKRDAALASIKEAVDMGMDPLAGLGDLAVHPPGTVRVVAGQRHMMVQVYIGEDGKDATTASQEAVALARKALAG